MSSSQPQSSPTSPPPTENHHDQVPPSADGKRKGGRVFTEEDEIALLKSFCKAAKNSASSPPRIDPPTFEKMGKSLGPNKFTHAQLSDKLRRLKVKYKKQARTKSCIATPHDRQIYEIGRKIWGKEKEAPPQSNGEESLEEVEAEAEAEPEATPGEHEEEGMEDGGVNLGKFPLLVDECERAVETNGVWSQVLRGLPEEKLREMNDKLVMLKYEEAALMAKKAEMVHELTRMILSTVAASFLSASRALP